MRLSVERPDPHAADRGGLRRLATLAGRPRWLATIVLSALAWVAEAGALALAPVPIVTTLRSTGRGMLIGAGQRWLGEEFNARELVGVGAVTIGGVLAAIGASHSSVGRAPLPALVELAVAGVVVVLAWAVSRLGSGLALGCAVGLLFVSTGIFTKEIGDRVAVQGLAGVVEVLASPAPWVMVALSVWAQSLLQDAFRRANAASVSATNAAVSSLGLVAAGFLLYHERVPTGLPAVALACGVGVSVAGTVLIALGSGRPSIHAAAP